jgi:hypothetical protein
MGIELGYSLMIIGPVVTIAGGLGIDGSINYLFREKIDELLKDSCTELASINKIVESLSNDFHPKI